MKLYRHYKNKNYRLLGQVRHSETLEEMALYECLYPNDKGRLWVRPKDLFYGEIEVEGQCIPRFAKVPVQIRLISQISAKIIEQVEQLSRDIFSNSKNQDLTSAVADKKDPFLVLAEVDEKAVGYKLGYRQDGETFYSWLGGVLPSYRGVGIASELMKSQHDWCRAQGYKKIQTKTGNQFLNMMILNLKSGFKIQNTAVGKNNEVRIFMEKIIE